MRKFKIMPNDFFGIVQSLYSYLDTRYVWLSLNQSNIIYNCPNFKWLTKFTNEINVVQEQLKQFHKWHPFYTPCGLKPTFFFCLRAYMHNMIFPLGISLALTCNKRKKLQLVKCQGTKSERIPCDHERINRSVWLTRPILLEYYKFYIIDQMIHKCY